MTKITNFHILFDKNDNNHIVRQQIENNSDKIAAVFFYCVLFYGLSTQ